MYFCEKLHKMFTKREPDTNFNFTEVLQDCCCLQHTQLASIKEKKITPRALIKMCTAYDRPYAILQSILLRAYACIDSSSMRSAIVYASVSYKYTWERSI